MARLVKAWSLWVLVSLAVLTAYGFATNDGGVGMLLGGAAGVATDPLMLGAAFVIGLTSQRWWVALLSVAIIGIGMQLLIEQMNADTWGAYAAEFRGLALTSRWLALGVLAAVVSLVALPFRGAEPAAAGDASTAAPNPDKAI